MYRLILVPLDGSPFAEYVLPAAVAIAARAGAEIQLVHVFESVLAAEALETEANRMARDEATEYLNSVAARTSEAGRIRVSSQLLRGAVVPKLLGQARRSGADLIVMTTHGRGGLSRFWLGSTADELVRRSALPVLLVRPQEGAPRPDGERSFRHLLVPLDGSRLGEQVLPQAMELARLFEARVTLLRVAEPGPRFGYPSVPHGAPLEPPNAIAAERYLHAVAEPLRSEGLELRTAVVRHPVPAKAIVEYAESAGVDLIAIATHGRGGLSRLVLGGTADKVIRISLIPVLAYRPGGPAARASRPTERGPEPAL